MSQELESSWSQPAFSNSNVRSAESKPLKDSLTTVAAKLRPQSVVLGIACRQLSDKHVASPTPDITQANLLSHQYGLGSKMDPTAGPSTSQITAVEYISQRNSITGARHTFRYRNEGLPTKIRIRCSSPMYFGTHNNTHSPLLLLSLGNVLFQN